MLEKSKPVAVEDDSEKVIDFCFRNLKIFPKFHANLQVPNCKITIHLILITDR